MLTRGNYKGRKTHGVEEKKIPGLRKYNVSQWKLSAAIVAFGQIIGQSDYLGAGGVLSSGGNL